MAISDAEQAAAGFLALLSEAAASVADRWFLLPVAVTEPTKRVARYRERVYCYELYHQIRVRSRGQAGRAAGAPRYVLSGEIDKSGLNAVIDGGRHKPDLVWHVPGHSTQNALVVEIKAGDHLGRNPLRKDLNTLGAFLRAERGYRRAALLVYGRPKRGELRERVLQAADDVELSEDARRRTRLLWHPAAGRSTEDLGTLERVP